MSQEDDNDDQHGDDPPEIFVSMSEERQEQIRLLWDCTLGRRGEGSGGGGGGSVGELCETLSQWSGHRDWARAICTLLPSRRAQGGSCGADPFGRAARATTLPKMTRISPGSAEDPETLVVRRQLSSATHRRRPGSVCLSRALSMRAPQGEGDEVDSVFDTEGADEPLSELEQAEMRAAIRNLPVPLALRRVFRNQLQKAPRQPGDQFDAWDFKSMKAMKKASEMGKDITGWLSMWSSSLKTIEGHFGTGVASYFLFLRWLLLLNTLMFLMPALLIIVPHWVFPTMPLGSVATSNSSTRGASATVPLLPSPVAYSAVSLATSFPVSTVTPLPLESEPLGVNRTLQLVQECYEMYHGRVSSQTREGVSHLQDFLQGTGWMELTALFAGRYLNSVDHVPGTTLAYNFPLAYVLANVGCFVLCLLLMVQYTRKGIREALLLSEGKLHRYCNLVFASWDFCITDQRTARLKHISIIQELKSDLAEERRNMEIARWSRGKKVGLFVVRLVANILVVAVVAASWFAVYWATSFSFGEQSQAHNKEGISALAVQFVPSLVITGLNLMVPLLFSVLIRYENYSVGFQVKLNLLRTVFLRFTSIFVLLLSLDRQINCTSSLNSCLEGVDEFCKKPLCWETAVGQQIYKLTILDFAVSLTLVFALECPRKFLVTRFDCRLTRLIGQQEFNIPNRVLDLVYSQTLCWLGTFYCPLLPAISIIKYFIIFYVQKFTLMHNSQPSQTPYRASRSNTFFVVVLLMALFLAVMPFAYALVEIPPSLACGPFQRFGATWDVVRFTVLSWGWPLVDIINFFTSVAFAVPAVVVLAITVYYYWSVSAAHVHMEKALKDKLVLEGKDKQFLLARITEVARQQAGAHP